ncbi:hypothetical protein DIPPA_12527 [Diplonema papillatum]|nr:hypothetical protein DIPPA_12527 [Diplonema papillatum]
MGQCCLAAQEQDGGPEFEDIRDASQADVDKRMAAQSAHKQVSKQRKAEAKLSRYATEASSPPREADEPPEDSGLAASPPPSEGAPARATSRQSQSPPISPPPPPSFGADNILQPPSTPKLSHGSADEKEKEKPAETSPPAVETPKLAPKPVPKTLKQREAQEEQERVDADRKKKEQILAEGEVRIPATAEWAGDDDFEIADMDDHFEINMDDDNEMNAIQTMSEEEGSKPRARSASRGASPAPSPVPEYPSEDWYTKHETSPPSTVLYYHASNTLTIAIKPYVKNQTKIEFLPQSCLHYSAPGHEVHLNLLYECTEPRLLSMPIECTAGVAAKALKASARSIEKAISSELELKPSFGVEIKQISELGRESAECVVRVLGPIGSLTCLQTLDEAARKFIKRLAEGKTFCETAFKHSNPAGEVSACVRLVKPSSARWSSLIKPPPGKTSTLVAPPKWIIPDDADESDDDDDDDDDLC